MTTLTYRGRAIRIEQQPQADMLRLRCYVGDQEVADLRLTWTGEMLYLDAYTADEIAEDVEVPALDMRVLYEE